MDSVNAKEIMGIIPDELLDRLAIENKVDYSVKKLKGRTIFQLFVYGILSGKMISLRILEAIFKSDKFQKLFDVTYDKVRHSSLGIRINNVDYHYFENIFKYLITSDKVNEIIFSNKKINARKIDSTLVLLSSKLLKVGMDDNPNKKSLKYSVEINQGIPVNIILFKDQKFLSEENALPVIVKDKTLKNTLNIAIFDRGIQKKQTFIDFSKNKIFFISRVTKHCFEIVKELEIKNKQTTTLNIISDQIVNFKIGDEKITNEEFRLVIGENKKTKEIISFITNVFSLSADEITDLYKSRWEIETFFKFIKQDLNFSHLLSRSENGIKVVMYLTMIVAILLTLYKRTNKTMGWAVAKIMFLNDLEKDLMNDWHFEMTPAFETKNSHFLAKVRDG